MNVLFITLGNLNDMSQQGIYTDLLTEFKNEGHNVYAICPMERKNGKQTKYVVDNGISVLHAKTGNITKCSIIEKGISTLLIEKNFKNAIKKYYSDVRFDLVIYSTPPITFCNVIKYVRNKDNAKTFLLLKDIFPQNAVDLGMFSKRSIIYKFFRRKEKILYKISDFIGCMSPANVRYVINHNDINQDKVGIAVNGIKPRIQNLTRDEKINVRKKYNLPLDRRIFVYGGNLGRPQGLEFMLDCINDRREQEELYLIVGAGTEFKKIKTIIESKNLRNVTLIPKLPKQEYEMLVKSCDVGLIFLDYRFSIPNFPSRLLSYMQAGLPVLACTDRNCDVGEFIETHGIGAWSPSDSLEEFSKAVESVKNMLERENIQESVQNVFLDNFTSRHVYEAIMRNI